jgi:hypothetical protein
MKVFSDLHHQSLYHSLQLLFEKRLGGDLYRPTGMQWYQEGFWKINNLEETAKQYLEREELFDPHHNTTQKALTFEQFKDMDIDIVIASVPSHIEPFKRLIREFKPNAKLIVQMGNMFSEITSNLHEIPNLLASTVRFDVPSSCNAVFYHQEFDLDVFQPGGEPKQQIVSFINVLQQNAGYQDYAMLKVMMPDYAFASFGGQCENGAMIGIENIAATMRDSQFGFHSKWGGDGYGHVLYNWYACGRPVITRMSDYKGKLGEELLEDEETCIDLDQHSFEEVCGIIRTMPPHKYQYMCQQAYQRFKDLVDFSAEEQSIREFLSKLN